MLEFIYDFTLLLPIKMKQAEYFSFNDINWNEISAYTRAVLLASVLYIYETVKLLSIEQSPRHACQSLRSFL